MVRATSERANERRSGTRTREGYSFEVDVVRVETTVGITNGCVWVRARGSVSQSVSDDGDLGLVSKRDRVDGGVDDGATMDQRCGMVKTLKRKF